VEDGELARINTDMRIQNLLSEGVIKVPESMLKPVMQVVCMAVFTHFTTFYVGDEEPLKLVNQFAKIAGAKYGKFPINEISDDQLEQGYVWGPFPVRVAMADLDPRYLKGSKRDRTISVSVGSQIMGETGASYNGKNNRSAIKVDISKNHFFPQLHDPKYVKNFRSYLEMLEGYVEHELMHFVQDKGIGMDVGAEANAYYNDDDTMNLTAYFGSEVEFGPNILTAYKTFVAAVRAASMEGIQLKGSDQWKAEITAFTVPERAGKVFGEADEFFVALYKNDRQKWKKAVKNFIGLFQSRSGK
jgi:hypothetical protein